MKYTKEQCIKLLTDKSSKLNRLPKKDDFTPQEVVAIKAFLGPWPRALEAAGLKPLRDASCVDKKREKRIRAKRKLTAMKKDDKRKEESNEN